MREVSRITTRSRARTRHGATLALMAALLVSLALAIGLPEAGAATPVTGNPFGHLETMRSAGSGLTVTVGGWAIDSDTTAPISVDLYLDGHWYLRTTADMPRPDVGAAFPASGPDHGFSADVTTSYVGNHVVCAYAINVGAGTTNPFIGCQGLYVSRDPIGNLDSVSSVPSGPASESLTLSVAGWAIDPDTTGPISVDIYVLPTVIVPVSTNSGVTVPVPTARSIRVTASAVRQDVGAVYPLAGADHGFSAVFDVPVGTWTVCAYGINVGSTPGLNPQLGRCKLVSA
jgi:hypothetical protein